jgi:hypothetical protein
LKDLSGATIPFKLVGMGDSEKLPDSGPGSYRFIEHRRYLEALDVRERVNLGSGFDERWIMLDLFGRAHCAVGPLA